jgi:hypothetical protein
MGTRWGGSGEDAGAAQEFESAQTQRAALRTTGWLKPDIQASIMGTTLTNRSRRTVSGA